jgi:hypothetical protein
MIAAALPAPWTVDKIPGGHVRAQRRTAARRDPGQHLGCGDLQSPGAFSEEPRRAPADGSAQDRARQPDAQARPPARLGVRPSRSRNGP